MFVTGALDPGEAVKNKPKFCSNHSVHVVRDCESLKNWFDENKEITTTEHISACYSANESDAVPIYADMRILTLIYINSLFADFNFQ